MVVLCVVAGQASAASSARPAVRSGSLDEAKSGWWIAGDAGAEIAVGATIGAKLAPGTSVRVLRRTTRLWLDPDSRHVIHTLIVNEGRVEVNVDTDPKQAKAALLVRSARTPFGIVKSGPATLVGQNGAWALATSRGAVLLYKDRGWRELPEWALQQFRDGSGTVGLPEALPGAPAVTQICRPSIVIDSGTTHCSANWQPIASARAYRVELTSADGTVDRQEVAGTSARFELPAGRYSAVVQPVGPFDLAGPRSAPASMTILGLRLPAGGYRDARGDFRIPIGARVAISQSAHVAVAYGAGDSWVDAPAGIGLLRDRSTPVRLRVQGEAQEHHVRLVPRSIRAEVAIGPRTATWPHDQLVVTVRMVDERGVAVPEWLDPDIRVSIGVRKVPVHWKRAGSAYRAVLRPPAGSSGPWVVRVDVRDSFGAKLGYDFLEVARSESRSPAGPRDLRASRSARSATD